MLTADLTVTDSGTATKPGALGAKVFAQVASPVLEKTVRRIAATATTIPNEMTIQHGLSGTGYKQRCRSVIRFDIRRLDTDVSLTGGITPSASAYLVIDRPLQSNGYITLAHLQTLVGQVVDVTLASGNLDKVLNMEG